MAGSSGDRHADRGAAPALSLRQLAAVPPSFDQALDDLIARAHDTERPVGDDDVIASEPAHAAFLDATTDPLGVSRDDASSDSLTDPFATDPYADPTRSDASLDATTDPFADPTRSKPHDDHDERAEAYQLALRGQLAGLQRRVAVAEAHEPALRDQLADLQRRLAAAEAREVDAARLRRRTWLAVALAFAAGLAVMFAVSRLGDRSASRTQRDPAASDAMGAGGARSGEPIVTPIDPPPIADPSSGLPSGASRESPPLPAAPGSAAPVPKRPSPAKPTSGAGAASGGPTSAPAMGSGRAPPSGGLVDPFAGPSGGAGSGSATESPAAPPPGADGAPRDAGAIVNPFGNG